MLNASDLQLKNVSELHDMLGTKREELRHLRFSVGENQLKNVRAIRDVRGDIARILGAIGIKNRAASST